MSRFNLRKKPRISYYEPDEPNLDEYIYCSRCGDYVYEYCSIHGALLVVPDDKVPPDCPAPAWVPRAALTIPSTFLHIAPSTIPGSIYCTYSLGAPGLPRAALTIPSTFLHIAPSTIPGSIYCTYSLGAPGLPRAALTIPSTFLHIAPSTIPGSMLSCYPDDDDTYRVEWRDSILGRALGQ
ncbi:hypothetical protein JYU34_000973 [Plutella xylostella]|uniref:Cuticular protein n=1 Tax=Plutella xylostella TaxID=51655 RepID=A0ABQ7R5R7_PLUXY|nr:hypothetical protein JYU34_000973 [Plutella xylostella]